MQTKIAAISCYQPGAPVRFDSLIAQKVKTLYFMGDAAYMDGNVGSTASPFNGDTTSAASYPATGTGAVLTIGAATTANGVAGQLPLGAATVTNGGKSYGFDPTFTYDANLSGNSSTGAVIQFTTCTAVTFTAAITATNVATLTAGLAEGNGKFWFGFSDGSRKLVTVSAGTSCTWTGNITATTAATYSQGGAATFTGALTAASSATLTGALSQGDGTFLFNFSDGSSRMCTVVGTAVSWSAADPVTATSAATYADGKIITATVLCPGRGATNSGSATFGVTNWNGVSGFWTRRFAQLFNTAAWQDLFAARAAGQIRVKFMPDDHERSNNWDFSVAQAPFGCFTLSDVLNYWRTSRAGINAVQALYFDNQPTAGRGDIPPSMVGVVGTAGVATAADFDWWLDYDDYDANNNLVGTPGAGPLAVRVIMIDCLSGKSTMATADSASKVMIGTLQEAAEQKLASDAVARGARAVWVLSGKDYFNLDNQDGWGATAGGGNFPYTTARDRRLLWYHTNNIPVVYWSGDRHCAHVSYTSTANGDSYDSFCVCATPFGSINNTTATTAIGNTPYAQMIWQHRKRDQLVYGLMTYDAANSQTVTSVVDNCDDTEQFAALIPFGSRVPSLTTGIRFNKPA